MKKPRRARRKARREPVVTVRYLSEEELDEAHNRITGKEAYRGRRRKEDPVKAILAGETYRAGGPVPSRKTASRTFDAQFEGICPRCAGEISVGDRVRYVEEQLVHARHSPKPAPQVEICDQCWLTKPCECD